MENNCLGKKQNVNGLIVTLNIGTLLMAKNFVKVVSINPLFEIIIFIKIKCPKSRVFSQYGKFIIY